METRLRTRTKTKTTDIFGYEPPPDQRAPHRDVLKWVQSLDLSHSLRNVRRDMSNGFMLAEMLSRYFPQDVQMHSFDNATSTACKKDNWLQLEKILSRKGIKLPEEVMEATMMGEINAGVDMLELLYEILNQKKLPKPEPLPDSGPNFHADTTMLGTDLGTAPDSPSQQGRMGGKRVTRNAKAHQGVEFGNISITAVNDASAVRRALANQ